MPVSDGIEITANGLFPIVQKNADGSAGPQVGFFSVNGMDIKAIILNLWPAGTLPPPNARGPRIFAKSDGTLCVMQSNGIVKQLVLQDCAQTNP